VAEGKASGIPGAGFNAEGEMRGHDVVAAEAYNISYGQRYPLVYVGQQHVVHRILYHRCHDAYDAEAYHFVQLITVHSSYNHAWSFHRCLQKYDKNMTVPKKQSKICFLNCIIWWLTKKAVPLQWYDTVYLRKPVAAMGYSSRYLPDSRTYFG
jgi:hypothetical protein